VRVIAVTNQKGGVGKTTTVANLGSALAARGVDVAMIDLDPQANLTMHFGIDPSAVQAGMYDVMTADVPLGRAAMMVEPHLTIVPSTIDLAAAEVELAGTVGREQVLRDRLADGSMPHELVLIDCPPSLGLLTLNALAAAGEVLIPLQPHFLALQGMGRLLETVALVQRRINPALRVSGVLFCMYESGTKLAGEVVEDVETFFADATRGQTVWSGATVFRTRVRRNIKLAECPSHGTTILHYDPASRGAEDYRALTDEFLNLGKKPVEDAPPPSVAAPESPVAEPVAAPPAVSEPMASAPAALEPPAQANDPAPPPAQDAPKVEP
jgi:chromosome partitioning protein